MPDSAYHGNAYPSRNGGRGDDDNRDRGDNRERGDGRAQGYSPPTSRGLSPQQPAAQAQPVNRPPQDAPPASTNIYRQGPNPPQPNPSQERARERRQEREAPAGERPERPGAQER
ncbi:MAG: hypothetical protein NVS9B10_26150 [Nevskia sp.]